MALLIADVQIPRYLVTSAIGTLTHDPNDTKPPPSPLVNRGQFFNFDISLSTYL
jgi:hypothetical protein